MMCAAPLYGCIISGKGVWNTLGLPLTLHVNRKRGVLTVFWGHCLHLSPIPHITFFPPF